jgi:circadian clock protein KaiB
MKRKSKSKTKSQPAPKSARPRKMPKDGKEKASGQDELSPMYSLRLYITGQTPRSAGSVQNLKNVCDQYLAGKFELEVIDIYQQPELAQKAQIIAAPTLVRRLPLPLRRLVGDLSNRQRVLMGLDLMEVHQEEGSAPRNETQEAPGPARTGTAQTHPRTHPQTHPRTQNDA